MQGLYIAIAKQSFIIFSSLFFTQDMIEIKNEAQSYLRELLAKQEDADTGIRVFVARAGTPYAETCIAYCREGEQEKDDQAVGYDGFTVWFEGNSEPYLKDAVVDFQKDDLGGQLTIRAPNARVPNVDENSPLEDRVNYVLYNDINPSLAAHGGMVSLVEIVDGSVAVLQFGGGCQGCSAVDTTLKQGVERALIEQIPEITEVRDTTDHSITDNAYYR